MKEALTPRERVSLALNHCEPDRVPVDITYTWAPYVALRQALGLPKEVVKPDVWGRVHESRDLVDTLGTDFLHDGLNRPSTAMRFSLDLDEYTTEYGVVFRKIYRPDGSFQFEMRDYPLKQPSLDAIQKYPWPDPLDAARYRGVEERVRHLYETTDYAITCRLGENIFEQATYMRGQENWLMDLILHRDFAVALMQRLADIQRTIYLKGLDLVGKYISVIRLGGEDLGTQHGPLISLQMFRELVKPILASVYLPVKAKFLEMNPNGKLMLHSCGSVRAFINDFIESGVDVLDPVQTQAEGMNGLSLKREFGNAISFHGGINTQSVLPFGTKEDVELESKRKLEMLAPGGGYILDPSHNVQADVPPRNLIRMVEVAKSYGRYPIQRNFSDDELLALCV